MSTELSPSGDNAQQNPPVPNPDAASNPENYSEEAFWEKVKRYAKAAGSEVLYKAFLLYYLLQQADVPVWAKSVVISALAYFIFPVDAIPDVIPVVGYADDLGVLAAALATVAFYVSDEARALVNSKLKDWLG